jgi:predicted alpha/beta-fold hydrolase
MGKRSDDDDGKVKGDHASVSAGSDDADEAGGNTRVARRADSTGVDSAGDVVDVEPIPGRGVRSRQRGSPPPSAASTAAALATSGRTASSSSSAAAMVASAASSSSSSESSSQRRRRPQSPPPPPRRARPTLQRSSVRQFMCDLRANLLHRSYRSFRAMRRQSSSVMVGMNDNLPTTPSGWALLALSAASLGVQYELRVQRELTAPPIVFCQDSGRSALNERMDRIHRKLSCNVDDDDGGESGRGQGGRRPRIGSGGIGNGDDGEGIFARKVTPSLFIGTRGLISSAAAYAFPDFNSPTRATTRRVREVMKMGADGAMLVLDWEIPLSPSSSSSSSSSDDRDDASDPIMDVMKPNGIDRPVVIILHGMNNDSTFGYVRSMMRTATERGWVAVCMNLRGQDGLRTVKNNTPRGYNAGYTGDLRGVVQQIEYRLKRSDGVDHRRGKYAGGPIFLLGYSLGANIVTKYLGEESLHGTLPECIGGGAAMGNPLHIHSGSMRFPWNVLLAAGIKRSLLQNYRAFRGHHDPGFQRCLKKACMSPTIGKLDDAVAPYLIRNDNRPPYAPRIGFEDGEEYWWDSSSHRYVAHVSVPLLMISAQDDFLVFGQFARKLNHCLENPNVVVVKTRCGGHLGWQERPPLSKDGKRAVTGSWSDVAVADFIEALLQIREEDRNRSAGERNPFGDASPPKVLSKL